MKLQETTLTRNGICIKYTDQNGKNPGTPTPNYPQQNRQNRHT